jgi:short-subunit dehydrogenase
MPVKKRLFITGASSGVGRSLVHHLKGRFEIVAVARRLERMKEEFGADESVSCYKLDLTGTTTLGPRLDEIIERHYPIPYLINNAGVLVDGPVERVSGDAVRESFEVNALAPMTLMQKMLPAMQTFDFGRIINMTSVAPLTCKPNYAAYSASKSALNAITVTVARENADANIKINLMSPGPVQTEMAPEAPMTPSSCHSTVDYLLGLDEDGPTGQFFWLGTRVPLSPHSEWEAPTQEQDA